jgi:hypothetical protein
MGDIDMENFNAELLAKFESDLDNASFMAIDLEMTGISFPNKSENGSDTVAFRYSKIRGVASTFGIIQVGVAIFNAEKTGATVYNFYVFPRPVTEGAVDSIPLITLCSASTNFNKSHGMDFGRWVNKGITYVTADVEKKLRESLLEDPEAGAKAWEKFFGSWQADESVFEQEEYRTQETRILQEVEEMMRDPTVSSYKVPFVHGGQKWLKSIVNTVHEKYPELRMVEEVSGGGSSRLLTKKSTQNIFDDYVGFRRVWSLITGAGKPVVFHNGFLDLMFCYQAFENELPNNIEDFKIGLQKLFPAGVFDTRLIAIESNLSMAGSAALETLADMFGSPNLTVSGSGKYDSLVMQDDVEHKYHEAGYDALLTGKVFVGLSEKLNNDVSAWKNCMCISRCIWVLTIDTLDSDRLLLDCGVGKNRIVRILSDIRPKCSTRDILNHFEELKAVISTLVVNIQWTNDTSGVLLVTWTQPAEKSVDSVTTALSSRIIELVKLGGAIGESVKVSSANEYVKMQLEELSPEYIAAQKKFRV